MVRQLSSHNLKLALLGLLFGATPLLCQADWLTPNPNSKEPSDIMYLEIANGCSVSQFYTSKDVLKTSLQKFEEQPSLYNPPTLLLAAKAYYKLLEEGKGDFWFHAGLLRARTDLDQANLRAQDKLAIEDKLLTPILETIDNNNIPSPALPNEKQTQAQEEALAWNEVTPKNYDPVEWVEKAKTKLEEERTESP